MQIRFETDELQKIVGAKIKVAKMANNPHDAEALIKYLAEKESLIISVSESENEIEFNIKPQHQQGAILDELPSFISWLQKQNIISEQQSDEMLSVVKLASAMSLLKDKIIIDIFEIKREIHREVFSPGASESDFQQMMRLKKPQLKEIKKAIKESIESLEKLIQEQSRKLGQSTTGMLLSLLKKQKSYLKSLFNEVNFAEVTYESRLRFLGKNKKLHYLLTHLEQIQDASKFQSIFLDEQISIKRLVLKEQSLAKLGIHNLKRVAAYIGVGGIYSLDKDANRIVLEVTTKTGVKMFVEIPKNLLSTQELEDLFADHGAYVDLKSLGRGKGPLGEEFFRNLHSYTKEIEEDYENIHREIKNELQHLLDPSKTYEFIFIGCGKGEEVKELLKFLESHNVKYRIYGIDLDKESIKAAESASEFQGKRIKFIAGNANNFDQLLNQLRGHFTDVNPDISITISSGFSTRQVNLDPVEAYEIFKMVMHHSQIFLISGRTETLINNRDAKQSGVINTQRTYRSNKELRTMDIFETLDTNQQVEWILEKMQASPPKSPIPLANNPSPIRIIQELTKQMPLSGSTIDLRGTYIDLEEIVSAQSNRTTNAAQFLIELLQKEKVSLIVHGDEKWFSVLKPGLSYAALGKVDIKPAEYTVLTDKHSRLFVRETSKTSENLKQRALQEAKKFNKST